MIALLPAKLRTHGIEFAPTSSDARDLIHTCSRSMGNEAQAPRFYNDISNV